MRELRPSWATSRLLRAWRTPSSGLGNLGEGGGDLGFISALLGEHELGLGDFGR